MRPPADKGETELFCSDTACGKSFPTPKLLAAHVVRVHGVKKFPCLSPLCDKKFASLGDANNHFRQCHVSNEAGSFWMTRKSVSEPDEKKSFSKTRKRVSERDEKKKEVQKVVN